MSINLHCLHDPADPFVREPFYIHDFLKKIPTYPVVSFLKVNFEDESFPPTSLQLVDYLMQN